MSQVDVGRILRKHGDDGRVKGHGGEAKDKCSFPWKADAKTVAYIDQGRSHVALAQTTRIRTILNNIWYVPQSALYASNHRCFPRDMP